MRQMVSIPSHQGFVAGVFKQKFQCRRFDVAVAKDHVGFALVAGVSSSSVEKSCVGVVPPQHVLSAEDLISVAMESIANGHHLGWVCDQRGSYGWFYD